MAKVKYGGGITKISGITGGVVHSHCKGTKYIRGYGRSSRVRTQNQLYSRSLFSKASYAWTQLTSSQRLYWNSEARKTPYHNSVGDICLLTGKALYMQRFLKKSYAFNFHINATTSPYPLPTFTLSGVSGKTITIDWGDNKTTRVVFSGGDQVISKSYVNSGYYHVSFIGDYESLTKVIFGNFNATLNINDFPVSLTHLQLSYLGSNITGSINNLPQDLTYLYLYELGSNLSGSINNLPPSLTVLTLRGLGSLFTGSINNLPIGLTSIMLYQLGTSLTGSIDNLPLGLLYIYLAHLGSNFTYSSYNTDCRFTILRNLGFIESVIDDILCDVNTKFPTGVGTLTLTNNVPPGPPGIICKNALISRGWTVTTD